MHDNNTSIIDFGSLVRGVCGDNTDREGICLQTIEDLRVARYNIHWLHDNTESWMRAFEIVLNKDFLSRGTAKIRQSRRRKYLSVSLE
jgi:hypothetical protein